jgi:NAD+ kinase
MSFWDQLAFIVSPTLMAESLAAQLTNTNDYKVTSPEDADSLVVLGGDGFMLRTLHTYQSLNKPVYGVNCGTVGFLMNQDVSTPHQLLNRLKEAVITTLHPLKSVAYTSQGTQELYAINEISLLRQTPQAAKIRISINHVERLKLIGDGLIVATPAGSTAYNLSAHGPILPLGSSLIALTPLNPFRPRHWRGALLPQTVKIQLDILEPEHRHVSLSADDQAIFSIYRVDIHQDLGVSYQLLFDPGHNLEERILKEQFMN